MMKIAVVGAGASGMMCVATLIEKGFSGEIFLFDKNKELGKKVAITGGGRCNVTTGLRDRKKVLSKYPRGADFLDFSMRKFSPLAVYRRFEKQGVPLKIEDAMRVFPQSNKSTDVISVFEKMFLSSKNVNLQLGNTVNNITKNEKGFLLETGNGMFVFDKLVIATGGSAYGQTGSTGDAYSWARKLGHYIGKLSPSLSSFEVAESWIKKIPGTVFFTAQISVEGQKFVGPLLFTHGGISGPLTFELSAFFAHKEISNSSHFSISVKFFADKDYLFWNEFLLSSAGQDPNKTIKNIISNYFTKKFSEVFLLEFFPHLIEEKIGNLRKDDRKSMCHLFSGELFLTLLGRKSGDEFVTAGGVSTVEINPKTMESNVCPGLYFVGEIVDVDGVTGGFNLQACWAMGRVVGEGLMKNE